ncbi:hypothetical protein MM236_01195 [Belliella sp. DSM 107340]|uniref:Uncharacterized protein n=1 Tax=Belliella calami TaxID=2923436 RepID=A0ABS9UIX5_9BACT|nr:hypothetical protein [Belliella calami]MCH7396577.1 hypothetical protein [Belliella calami]
MDTLTPLFEKLRQNEKRISENHLKFLNRINDLMIKYNAVIRLLEKSTKDTIIIAGGKERNDLKITIKEKYGEFKWVFRLRFSSNGNLIHELSTPYLDDKDYKRELQIDELDNEINDLKLIKSFIDNYVNSKTENNFNSYTFLG